MKIDLVKLVFPKRKGYRLINVGLLIVVACIFGGYQEYTITPLMQVVGIIAGLIILLMGCWFTHTRSKFKSSMDRKTA